MLDFVRQIVLWSLKMEKGCTSKFTEAVAFWLAGVAIIHKSGIAIESLIFVSDSTCYGAHSMQTIPKSHDLTDGLECVNELFLHYKHCHVGLRQPAQRKITSPML